MNDLNLRNTPARSYRHPLQIGPLVLGLVFLGVSSVWALYETEVVEGSDATWLLPAVLFGAGSLGVLLAALRPRRTGTAGYEPLGEGYDAWPTPGYISPPATAYDELMAQVPPPDIAPPAGHEAATTGTHHPDPEDRNTHDETMNREHHDD